MIEYSVRNEGLADFTVKFKAIDGFRDKILDAMQRAAQEAGSYMGTHVPYETGGLYRAINVGQIRYKPGGAGGGGSYEVHVGVDESQAPYAEAVLEGTGIYNRESPKNGIYPATGNVMAFEKMGEGTVFTAWTRGQEPRREWFDDAQDLAQSIIARAVAGES
jgi:hypothetical protein